MHEALEFVDATAICLPLHIPNLNAIEPIVSKLNGLVRSKSPRVTERR